MEMNKWTSEYVKIQASGMLFSHCTDVHTIAELLVCGTLEGSLYGKADGTICCLVSVSGNISK